MWFEGDYPEKTKVTQAKKPAKQKGKPAVQPKGPGFKISPAHRSQERILQQTKVYVMHNVPVFWLNKFGISDKPKARSRNVSETTAGFVFYLFAPELEFGWHIEQFVHRLYQFQNVHFWTGSGRTEWFLVFSPVVGSLVLFGSYYLNINLELKYYVLAYFTPFVWLDGLFWLALFWTGRMAVIMGAVICLLWFLAHAK